MKKRERKVIISYKLVIVSPFIHFNQLDLDHTHQHQDYDHRHRLLLKNNFHYPHCILSQDREQLDLQRSSNHSQYLLQGEVKILELLWMYKKVILS